jgi:hypothetical protein
LNHDGAATDLQRAAEYWDANREKAKDPAFWMAHPLCRKAINRRVSGSEHEMDDPSEAIRSDEIPKFIREFFDVIEWRPYGGQVTDLVMPCISGEWAASEAGSRFVQSMLDIEDWELTKDSSSSHHLVVYGTLKTTLGLAWPLGRQVFQAAQRRLTPPSG